jgi:hypothetical protein
VLYNSLGALNGTLIKAVQGSAGVEGTWGTRRRGRGTPMEKNKNILWEIRRERTSGGR